MRLAVAALISTSLLAIGAASSQQLVKKEAEGFEGGASRSTSNVLQRLARRSRDAGLRLDDGRPADVFEHGTDGLSDSTGNNDVRASSTAPGTTARSGRRGLSPRAMAGTPFTATTTVTETIVPSKYKATKFSSESDSWVASQTASSSASSSASTATQTARIIHNRVNMTLANMPYEQVMCDNTTEVQSGSVLNATWLSKGKYTNSVYIRYATDGYAAWNLPVGGTLPPFAGIKVKKKSSPSQSDEFDELEEDYSDNPDANATYRMTFQTQVFAYQKGLKLSIVVFDNEKGLPVVNYESPEIFIKAQCKRKEKEPISNNDGRRHRSSPNATKSEEEQPVEQDDGVEFSSDIDKVDAKSAGAKVNMIQPLLGNSHSSKYVTAVTSETDSNGGSRMRGSSCSAVSSIYFVSLLVILFGSVASAM